MKVGDLIRVHLPYIDRQEIAIVLERNDAYPSGHVNPDPGDVWWKVFMYGEVCDMHQDHLREIINESR